jgi:hypothetical protein
MNTAHVIRWSTAGAVLGVAAVAAVASYEHAYYLVRMYGSQPRGSKPECASITRASTRSALRGCASAWLSALARRDRLRLSSTH